METCNHKMSNGESCGRTLHDDEHCIFHSTDIERKKKEFKDEFWQEFERQKKSEKPYDFKGFVFPDVMIYPLKRLSLKKTLPSCMPRFQGKLTSGLPRFQGQLTSCMPRFQGELPSGLPRSQGQLPSCMPRFQGELPSGLPRFQGKLTSGLPRFQGKLPSSSPRFQGKC